MLGIMPGRGAEHPADGNDSGGVFSSDEDSGPGCSPKSSHERRHGAKRFSLHRKKDRSHSLAVRDLLPARLIRTTLVKPNTLNPVWKERFRL